MISLPYSNGRRPRYQTILQLWIWTYSICSNFQNVSSFQCPMPSKSKIVRLSHISVPPSSTCLMVSEATTVSNEIPTLEVSIMDHSGITSKELQVIQRQVIDTACAEGIGISITCQDKKDDIRHMDPPTDDGDGDDDLPPGILGRIVLVYANLADESLETFSYAIAEQMDRVLYGTDHNESTDDGEHEIPSAPLLLQPVLIKLYNTKSPQLQIATNDIEDGKKSMLSAILKEEVLMYGLNEAIQKDHDRKRSMETTATPTIHVELDAANITDDYTSTSWWDRSTVLVFDDLISDDLRKRLLDLVLGHGKGNEENEESISNRWNDTEDGPDPQRWIRGGLMDTTQSDSNDEGATNIEEAPCWGLRDEVIEELCFQSHAAIDEVETILSQQVFPQYTVSRLPEAVFGACVSPLTANAPTYGDVFDYHIDGDPNLTPPSPWTDIYGRYPNRMNGKPRFMSVLLYLNDEWDAKEWGAPTRFLDPPTQKTYDVMPQPRRCVIMDQDVSHTVVAPNASAGKRPRYSLVWKLILHPKSNDQSMTNLADGRAWPSPIMFGSATKSKI